MPLSPRPDALRPGPALALRRALPARKPPNNSSALYAHFPANADATGKILDLVPQQRATGQSTLNPVTSSEITSFGCASSLQTLYRGRSSRLKHVCARETASLHRHRLEREALPSWLVSPRKPPTGTLGCP